MNLKHKLIAKVRKEFPKVKLKNVELITKGWDHDVLVLDNKFIFRFAKEKLDRNSFFREVKFLKEFSKISNLRVPEYLWLAKDKSFGGYRMIKGRELTPKIYKRLSFVKKRRIINDLARFVNILHKIPLKKARQFGFEKYKSWQKDIADRQQWFRNEFEKKVSPKLTASENAFIKNFISSHYKSQYSIKPTLGHYDLSHDHIIMNKDGSIAGIIDFGDITIGDPAHEFNGFFDYDQKMPLQIYKLYTGPKDKNFFKRSKEHFIHRWIYLLYDGLIRRKNKALWKEAKQKLRSFI